LQVIDHSIRLPFNVNPSLLAGSLGNKPYYLAKIISAQKISLSSSVFTPLSLGLMKKKLSFRSSWILWDNVYRYIFI